MITFKICFLLAFDLEKKLSKKRNQNKRDKGTNVKEKKKKLVLTVDDKPDLTYDASNIVGAAHIQYELVPEKCRYEVEVVCWGPVAKIATNDGLIYVLTIVQNETAWVPVCLEHYVKELSLSQIKMLHGHTIEFDITECKDKAAAHSKYEKMTISPENLKDNNAFTEIKIDVDGTIRTEEPQSLEAFMRNIIMRCANFPKDEPVSWNHSPANYDIFNQTIGKVSSGKDVECRDFVLPCAPLERQKEIKIEEPARVKETKKKSRSKTPPVKKGKQKKTVVDNVKIKVAAEVFFTESTWTTYGVNKLAGFLKSAFVYLSVDQLLTRAQKLLLNPIVIKIKKISNLPVDILKKAGVEMIYASYHIPYIAFCETVKKPLDIKVVFNESHIHFSDTVSKIKVIEPMQTQKLFVEIYGDVKVPEVKPKCSLFGEKEEDYAISKIAPCFQHFEMPNKESSAKVLLAIATFDISSLIENVWDFREKAQCHQPDITLTRKPIEYSNEILYTDIKTANEINIMPEYRRKKHILTEAILLELGTTLKVEVYLMAPQAASLILHQIPKTFKRIFMVINNWNLAKSIFNEITRHNETSLTKDSNLKINDLANSEILTGFLIDNGNNFFFYLEGPSTGFILNIWHEMNSSDVNACRIFFNTDNAFEQRLYMHFISEGLYVVTLRIPFHDILAQPGLYCGKTPLPCMEALKRLWALFQSSQYRSILQQNSLPTANQLISLNLEWGVPLRWKEKIES